MSLQKYIKVHLLKEKMQMSTVIPSKSLVTVRKAAEVTGASRSFIRSLIYRGLLKKYSIRTAVYISLTEFEQLASEGHENVAA